MTAVLIGACVANSILSIMAMVWSIMSYVEFKSTNKSTHQVQMVPIEQHNVPTDDLGFEDMTDDVKKKLLGETFN